MAWLDLKAVLDRIRRKLRGDADELLDERPRGRNPITGRDRETVEAVKEPVVGPTSEAMPERPKPLPPAISLVDLGSAPPPESTIASHTSVDTAVVQSGESEIIHPDYAHLRELLASPAKEYSSGDKPVTGRFEPAVRLIEQELEAIAADKRSAAYRRRGGPAVSRLRTERIVQDLGVAQAVRFGHALASSGILTRLALSAQEREIVERAAARGWL